MNDGRKKPPHNRHFLLTELTQLVKKAPRRFVGRPRRKQNCAKRRSFTNQLGRFTEFCGKPLVCVGPGLACVGEAGGAPFGPGRFVMHQITSFKFISR